jgi:hypothetical protein
MTNFYSETKNSLAKIDLKTFSKNEFFRISVLIFLILVCINKTNAQAPAVNAPTVTSISTTSATLGGTVTGTLTHRGTRWSTTSPVGTSNELEVASTTAGAFTQARTGLPAGAKVFFVAYARNNADAGATSESSFFTEPTQLTGGQFTANATSSSAINLTFPSADSWAGSGATGGYVIYRRSGSTPTVAGLTDGAAPPADGVGDKIATITDGTFTSFNNNTGLSAETNYFYTIVPFVWDGADPLTYNYNVSAPQSANDYTFAAEPSGHATGSLTANAVSGTQINLTFNSVTTSAITNADGYIVLIKSTAIVAGDLTTLADGTTPNSFVLYKGIVNSTSDGSFSASGLSPSTTYHFAIIPFNRGADDQTYNYLTTTGFPTGSATTLTTATVTPIAGGTAPVIASTLLSAGSTLQVLTGFSITSDGTQTITAINFSYSATPTQFTTEYIYRSTTAGTLGSVILTDNTPDGNFNNWASVSAGNKTINSTPVYYYLVVDVANSVTSSTSSITVNPTQANITVAPGIVSTFSINRTFTFGTSQASDIILNTLNSGTTNPINYRNFVQTSIANDQSNSVSLANYIIQDGGGTNDPDNKGMSVTSIEFQITNSQNLRRIALFDDNANTEIAGTETSDLTTTGTTTIVLTPSSPIVVSDDGSFNINLRAIFKSTVTDKHSIQVSITNVTASSSNLSGFKPINTWASTQTAIGTNIITVNASKLVFAANPPNTAINTNFSLTVRAVDGNPYNNIDLDYTGKVDLTASGGSGTLTGGAQSLSPNLNAGVFTWNQLRINQSGTYSLSASDDDYTDPPESQNDIGDATGSVVINSSASTITQPATLNLCFGGIFKTLGNIVITETDPSGFSSSGSFSIGLPTGYIFDTSVTTAPVISNGTASPTTLSYTGDNIVQFSYNFSAGSSNTNTITISGLKIRYPGNTPPAGGGNITRVGGTASVAGVVDGTVLGTLTAALATPPGNLGFTVLKINSGDANVDPNETRFSVSGSAVQLIGTPSGSSFEFSGPGVTFTSGQWRFNPSTLSVGTGYNITYKVRDGADQCEFTFTKSFEVYSSSITNLATSYCTNQDASLPLSVSEAYIDANIQELVGITFDPITFTFSFIFQPNYNFDGFVYYNPSTDTYLDMPKQSSAPDVWVFDPKNPIYNSVYKTLPEGYGIRIGFRVKSTFSGGIRYQASFVEIRQAPTVAITSIINNVFGGDNSRFCNDQLPVTLTGSPANSSSSAQDEFFVDSAPQSATIGFNSLTSTWTFNPASVSGVSEGNPATFNILYRYTDKVNGCVSVSAPKQVRVYARPAAVQASQILANATQEICPGTPVSVVNANPVPGVVEYKWYKDNFPPLDPNPLIVGNSFTPPADILTPGTYEYYVTRTLGNETFTFFSFSTIVFAGCESNRQASNPPTPFQVSVTVKPIPPPPTIPNLTREYCVNASVPPSALQVTGTNVKWYNNGNVIFTGDSPTAANLGIDNTKPGDYTFNLTQTLNGCEGVPQSLSPFTDRLSVKIKPLPDVTITSSDDADLNRICTTDGLIKFSAAEGSSVAANGTWSGTGLGGALTPNALFGTVDLNPLNLSPGNYILQYAYTNPLTLCSNNFTKNFLIHPSVNVSVQASDACLGSPVVITNISTINGTGTIDSASWDFDDRSVLARGNYNTPVNSNEGRTQGSYRAPTHLYTTTGNYQIIGELKTNAGCTYKTPPMGVLISPLPKIDFSWRNVCRDGISNTQFLATETSTPQININNHNWNFNLTNTLTYTNAGSGSNPTVNYNLDGKDSVRLIVTTDAGCQDTLTKPVYIVPKYPAISETVSYSQNFETSTDGWIAGGINPSWSYEVLSLKGKETVATAR